MKARFYKFTFVIAVVLAANTPATASIIHTDVGATIMSGESYSIDVNGDGVENFKLSYDVWDPSDSKEGYASSLAFQSLDGGLTQTGVIFLIDQPGTNPPPIDGDFPMGFTPTAEDLMFSLGYPGGGSPGVYTLHTLPHHMALKTVIDGETHYGWAQVQQTDEGLSSYLTILDFAYESTPNAPIGFGSVPTPGTLAVLALGFVRPRQRKRSRQTCL